MNKLSQESNQLNTYNTESDEYEIVDFIIPEDLAGKRIDQALSLIMTNISRSKLTSWLKDGLVSLDNTTEIRPKQIIWGGEQVTINVPQYEVVTYAPEKMDLDIVYQDDDIIVINKPAGLIVHPGNGNWSGTLLNGLIYEFPELKALARAGIVHRLDKDTTGLMVVARTELATNNLVTQLQQRTVSRIYRAIVEGSPHKEGIINKPLGRDANNRTKMAVLEYGGKEAITNYRVLEYFNGFSYVECKLQTGRTHQIRVHMKSIGHPLVGDPTYGTKKINYSADIVAAIQELDRQALHAKKLAFNHPVTGKLTNFSTRLPDDIKNLLDVLNFEKFDVGYDDEADDENWENIYAR